MSEKKAKEQRKAAEVVARMEITVFSDGKVEVDAPPDPLLFFQLITDGLVQYMAKLRANILAAQAAENKRIITLN